MLNSKVGISTDVTVFFEEDPNIEMDSFDGYSFAPETRQTMKFRTGFLPLMDKHPVGMTMRDSS
jgi:hypothetical protein